MSNKSGLESLHFLWLIVQKLLHQGSVYNTETSKSLQINEKIPWRIGFS